MVRLIIDPIHYHEADSTIALSKLPYWLSDQFPRKHANAYEDILRVPYVRSSAIKQRIRVSYCLWLDQKVLQVEGIRDDLCKAPTFVSAAQTQSQAPLFCNSLQILEVQELTSLSGACKWLESLKDALNQREAALHGS